MIQLWYQGEAPKPVPVWIPDLDYRGNPEPEAGDINTV